MTRRERDERARDQEEQTRTEERVKIMTTHLLPLSTIAATLPVLFGPDGDADWPGQLVIMPAGTRGFCAGLVYVNRQTSTEIVGLRVCIPGVQPVVTSHPRVYLSLDLSAPSVAARVAGLCARALGEDSAVGWRIDTFMGCWRLTNGTTGYKWPEDGAVYGKAFKEIPVVLGAPWTSADHFLASLYLTLAPRIAALGGSRD